MPSIVWQFARGAYFIRAVNKFKKLFFSKNPERVMINPRKENHPITAFLHSEK